MIADKPLFGHGVGVFNREYMLYQANYFEQHSQSSFVMVADNVAYPYNELIHISIELGLFGACLLLVVFISGFTSRSSGMAGRSLKAGLAAFIVFSLFSYPAEIFELLLLPAVLLGALQDKPVYSLRVFCRMKLAGIGLLTGLIFFSVTGMSISRKIFEEIKQLTISNTQIPTPYCERYFPVFVYNAGFNMSYLSALCRFSCRPDYQSKIRNIFPSSETYCLLGEASECYGEYKHAEQLYQKTANMVPNRILPNYYLWRLYVKLGDHNQAHEMAQKILSQQVKMENTFTLQVKGEMRKYLKPE
ncbi:hypothetical protein FACS189451_12240 [Bacteroidia bacterium]|nr:hypothetical protein FACS189451_12240 [Bacteroidia bacterium]